MHLHATVSKDGRKLRLVSILRDALQSAGPTGGLLRMRSEFVDRSAHAAPMNFFTCPTSASGAMRGMSCCDCTGACRMCGYSLVSRSIVACG